MTHSHLKSTLIILATLLFFIPLSSAFAALDIEVTGAGEHQIPIDIPAFSGEEKLPKNISSIIAADLSRSGQFKIIASNDNVPHTLNNIDYLKWKNADYIVNGTVLQLPHNRLTVTINILDTVKKIQIENQSRTGSRIEIRRLAHSIANIIFEKLTGDAGVFNTRIAYIHKQGKQYQLVISDSDGYDEKVLITSNSIIMSPAWSPDGNYLAYVSFEKRQAVIFIQSLLTNQRFAVATAAESNTAPAWSPDGQELAFVNSKNGQSHLFTIRPDGTDLQQLTFDDEIDSEPNFSPDGDNIIFESNRSSQVQIYKMSVYGGDPERLTFVGGNNFSPHYSPDGKNIVFASWKDGKFFISTQNLDTDQVQVLTTSGWDENPSFAPNGKLILYATESEGQRVLETVTIDGRVKQKLQSQHGQILDPAWGPLTNRDFQ